MRGRRAATAMVVVASLCCAGVTALPATSVATPTTDSVYPGGGETFDPQPPPCPPDAQAGPRCAWIAPVPGTDAVLSLTADHYTFDETGSTTLTLHGVPAGWTPYVIWDGHGGDGWVWNQQIDRYDGQTIHPIPPTERANGNWDGTATDSFYPLSDCGRQNHADLTCTLHPGRFYVDPTQFPDQWQDYTYGHSPGPTWMDYRIEVDLTDPHGVDHPFNEVSVPLGETPMTDHMIFGHVKDTDGNPVANLPVPISNPCNPDWHRSVLTDKDGRFEYDNLEDGFCVAYKLDLNSTGGPQYSDSTTYAYANWWPKDYQLVWHNQLPSDFEVQPFQPGEYQFAAKATEVNGVVLSQQWDFGDGKGATGAVVSHTYTKPGQYVVTHTVGDGTTTGQTSHIVTVNPPTLGVTVDFLDKDGHTVDLRGVQKDSDFGVKVTLSASPDGVGPLHQVAFSGDPLQLSAAAAITLNSGPTPDPPAKQTLQPGDSVSYTYTATAAQYADDVSFTSTATATDDSGNPVNGHGVNDLAVTSPLVITVTPEKTPLKLADNDTGPVPQDENVKVVVSNPTNEQFNGVTLKALSIEPLSNKTVLNPPPLVIKTGPASGGDSLGSIAPGANKQKSYVVTASNGGKFNIAATVMSQNPDAPNPATAPGVSAVGAGELDINQPVILDFEMHLADGQGIVAPNGTVPVFGTVTDISDEQPLDLAPLIPDLSGNLGAGNPVDISLSLPADVPPLPLTTVIKPGDSVHFQANVVTIAGQGARGTVKYHPDGKVVNDDGSETALTPDEIHIHHGSDALPISIDDSVPTPDNASLAEQLGFFSHGFLVGMVNWTTSMFGVAKWLVTQAPSKLVQAIRNTPTALLDTVQWMSTYWSDISTDQRQAWYDRVAADIVLQTGQKYSQVRAAVDSAAQGFFTPLLTAYETGDDAKVADELGQISGNTTLEALTWTLKLPEAASIVSLAEKTKATQGVKRLSAGLKALTGGENLLAKAGFLLENFGLEDTQVQYLQQLAKKWNAQIAVRYRNSKSVQWIRQHHAVPKPEAVKLKTVDEIDWKYLGYREKDEGLVVLRKPYSRKELDHVLSKVDNADVKQAIESRWEARAKEWDNPKPGYAQSIKDMAKPLDKGGGMKVWFKYGENGIELSEPSSIRRVVLEKVSDDGGFRVLMTDGKSATPRLITGDVDIVSITGANGQLLTGQARVEIYKALQETTGIDIQHPDTFSWLNHGDVLDNDKLGLLADHVPGKEPLAVFDPTGGVTASFIHPKWTWFDKSRDTGFIWYTHGYRTPQSILTHFSSLAYLKDASITQKALVSAVPPTLWSLNNGGGANPTGDLGSCNFDFTDKSVGGVFEQAGNGKIEDWSPSGGWTPTSTSSCTSGGRGRAMHHGRTFHLLPRTVITKPVGKGATLIALAPASVYLPGVKSANKHWFKAGQKLVVDPGGKDQEITTITAVGPAGVAVGALTKAHPPAELVSVVPH
jgi:hypothetical protein